MNIEFKGDAGVAKLVHAFFRGAACQADFEHAITKGAHIGDNVAAALAGLLSNREFPCRGFLKLLPQVLYFFFRRRLLLS